MRRAVASLIHYGGLWQSLGAASLIVIFAHGLGPGHLLRLSLATYAAFQAIYIFDRYYDQHPRIRAHSRFMAYGAIALAALSVLLNPPHIFILAGGFAYGPLVKPLTSQVWLLKNIYVASVFGALVFIAADELTNWGEFLFVFTQTVLMQILLDIKDIHSDKKKQLKTLPNLIGSLKSVEVVLVSSVAIIITLAILDSHLINLAIASAFWFFVCIVLIRRSDRTGYYLLGLTHVWWLIVANILVQ